jgi:lipopolysaccharide transport system ATP-binding protein
MTDKIAIHVSHLSKQYRLGGPQEKYHTFRDAMISSLKAPKKIFNKVPVSSEEKFWALKDVSFDVEEGEVIGIIGRNGAGKSTLLKILSRITTPTEGIVDIYGRVGSLLEVGTGFHQELTGRENIYLSGSILGMKRREIDAKLDDIIKFSEIEKFLDTPVKRFSSGMYVRLAFAVAAHLEPEILLVDEVLAVGDAAFQKKCLGKMGEVAKEGRTILFVSHNMVAIQNLCNQCILLNEGKVECNGDTDTVINYYLNKNSEIQKIVLKDRKDRIGNHIMTFFKISLYNAKGELIDKILSGENVTFRFFYSSQQEFKNAHVVLSFNVRNKYGQILTNLKSSVSGESIFNIYRHGYFQCFWPNFNLRYGKYDCNIFCSINGEITDWLQSAFSIDVEDGDFFGTGKIDDRTQGDILIKHYWECYPIAD